MSLIKKGLGKSLELSKNTLELSKNTLEKLTPSKQEKSVDIVPYTINISKGIDATQVNPYYLQTQIIFNDKGFKKRIENILKEYKFRLGYKWVDENFGTFFKPKYDQKLEMSINAYPSLTEALQINLVVSLLSFGMVDGVVDFSNTSTIKSFNNKKIYFKTERGRNLFAEKLDEILNDFYSSHYKEYQRLKSLENKK